MILQNYDLDSPSPLRHAAGIRDVDDIPQLLDLGADVDARADAPLRFPDAAKRGLWR